MVIPRFVKAALAGETRRIFGDGKQVRCFSYIDDVMDGMLSLAEHPGAEGEVFNLGSTEATSIEDLALKVIEMTDSASETEYVPYEQAYAKGFEDLRRRVPDVSKAERLVGFKAKISLEEILRRVIEHFRKQPESRHATRA